MQTLILTVNHVVCHCAGCESFAKTLDTLRVAKQGLGEVMSAFEFLDAGSMLCVTRNLKLSNPIDQHPFYVLVETSGSDASHDEEKLNNFLETSMGEGHVIDGTIATDPSKINVSSKPFITAHIHSRCDYCLSTCYMYLRAVSVALL